MHIVHLTASGLFGGPERQMLGLAAALPDGFSSAFLSFSEGGRCRPFLATARAQGFDAAVLANDTPNLRAAVREVTAFLRGNFADVLVTHGYKSNLLGRPAARLAGIPIVSVSRGWTGENFKVRCYETLDRVHLRLMDRVVCVSAVQADRVRETGVAPDRVRVIRNAARLRPLRDPDPPMRDRLTELAGGGGPVILAAGRLSPEKGFHVLVEAADRVIRQFPDARFVLFGEGAERERLERRVAELGIGDRFRMPGFRDDLDGLLPWASAVVLPSFTEGLPNVALEAAAAGVPVVATAVGGTPEVILNGQTGFLVPPGEPLILADRTADLLRHADWARAFGNAARKRVHDHFSFAGQARAYRAMFAEVCPGVRKSRMPAACAC